MPVPHTRRTGSRCLEIPSRPSRCHFEPSGPRAHATQRAAAQRAHPPPGARSPGRFRASPASPGDGSDASVVSRRFHCCHFEPRAALLARNPPRNFSFSVLKLTDRDNLSRPSISGSTECGGARACRRSGRTRCTCCTSTCAKSVGRGARSTPCLCERSFCK
jgi:hypothetical protein